MPAGDYRIPQQSLSMVLLGPGPTVSHDAPRILARHNTGLAAIGEGGVRFYTAQPLLPDNSALARRQALAWADLKGGRMKVARRMCAPAREVLPDRDIAVLRGIEGARVKEIYRQAALRHGIPFDPIERLARRSIAERLRRDGVIPAMIDRIKTLFEEDGA